MSRAEIESNKEITNNQNERMKEINSDKNINESKESEINTIDKLFFKTKTKPYIYYLPLTEEQVKKKLENKNL